MALLPFLINGGVSAYTFGTSRSAASTEIFGYDRAVLPKTGQELRTDAFVSIASTNKTFCLGDLRVIEYGAEKRGTAGEFSLFIMDFSTKPPRTAVDAEGRSLEFHWYDVPGDDPALARAPGWYDADGRVRWDDSYAFKPGQAFKMQGNGLTLETNGQVLDTEVRWPVPHNSYLLVAHPWAKRANICDISFEGNGEVNIGGGVFIQTLKPSLEKQKTYSWYDVTHGEVKPVAYREPGFYHNSIATSRYRREDGEEFDLGQGFYVQGYHANEGEPAPDCEFVVPKLEIKMNDYQPGGGE